MTNRIPVTIVTGFLGTGKTTLLRHLLLESNQRLAVVVNEFGSIGLDGDLIKTCGFCPDDEIDGRLIELNNGCLCCTVQDDFLPTMDQLLNISDKLDGIIIETSGLALPKPLLQALDWPSVRTKVHVNSVVTMVDGEALAAGSPVGDPEIIQIQREEDSSLDHMTPIQELFVDQLKVADLVFISRADSISPFDLDNVKTKLSEYVRTGTVIMPVSYGKVDPTLILDIDRLNIPIKNTFAATDEHEHEHEHVHVHSGLVRLEANIDLPVLKKLLLELVCRFKVARLKGRVWLPGKLHPLQVQMVGPRMNTWFEPAPENAWQPPVSGVDLVVLAFDEEATDKIESALKDAFDI